MSPSSSSSSSSPDFSGPCPENGYYDVFLSFRGTDTRYGFTANLYQSLKNNKIYSFMDIKNLGYDINRLFEMVAISKMALVIYSESFADSAWCLKELKMILQRREEKKMLIVPIFYNIDVDELKHLTGKTGKYLDGHIQKHGETTVKEWKTAVSTLGHVSGLAYKIIHGRYEFHFIDEVIAKTKEKLEEWGKTLQSTSKPYNSGPAATEYDVFISFMGEDTRYSLVNHLHKTLMIQKVTRIFMDDRDLLKDDSVFEVIQRSKMAIVVFSENYASSKWCLRELVKILQCRKQNTTRQLVVLPIFYKITSTDLINQAATKDSMIASQLEEHVLDDEEAITVQSWRAAITELGYINGWPYSTAHSKRELAEFIRGLAEEILTILNRVDQKKESTKNQRARVSAKEENTQALAVQTDDGVSRNDLLKEGLIADNEKVDFSFVNRSRIEKVGMRESFSGGSAIHDENASQGPRIESFQIIGEAIPGNQLLGCGYSVRGTSLCMFQWSRHFRDGTSQYIEGATNPEYVVTADDVDKFIAVECIPVDNRCPQGQTFKRFANDRRKIKCDPDMQMEIDSYISRGLATFKVQVDSLEKWEAATLTVRARRYEIKLTTSGVVIVSEKFSNEFSIKVPCGYSTQFALISSDGLSYPINTSNVRMRDTVVVTMRMIQSKALDEKLKGKA